MGLKSLSAPLALIDWIKELTNSLDTNKLQLVVFFIDFKKAFFHEKL